MSWRQKFTTNLKQIKVFYCPRSNHSYGVRKFLDNNYDEIRELNPYFALNMRDQEDIKPFIVCYHDKGAVDSYDVANYTEEEIIKVFKSFIRDAESGMLPRSYMRDNKNIDWEYTIPSYVADVPSNQFCEHDDELM
mmetsp:Transcript_6867/g.10045  ORF Transcript_6867/g.10045 Transcript_6867/m.10045 type:complete len:136 (+) Transcript_6867:80-487(+)